MVRENDRVANNRGAWSDSLAVRDLDGCEVGRFLGWRISNDQAIRLPKPREQCGSPVTLFVNADDEDSSRRWKGSIPVDAEVSGFCRYPACRRRREREASEGPL